MSELHDRPAAPRPQLRMIGVLVGFFVILAVAALATGQPSFALAVALLAAIVFGYGLVNYLLTRRTIKRDGSLDAAVSDETDAVPSAPMFGDDETALGDTPEAHDEITPHDLPIGHPGRQAAEHQAGDHGGATTTGHADPSQAPPDAARP